MLCDYCRRAPATDDGFCRRCLDWDYEQHVARFHLDTSEEDAQLREDSYKSECSQEELERKWGAK